MKVRESWLAAYCYASRGQSNILANRRASDATEHFRMRWSRQHLLKQIVCIVTMEPSNQCQPKHDRSIYSENSSHAVKSTASANHRIRLALDSDGLGGMGTQVRKDFRPSKTWTQFVKTTNSLSPVVARYVGNLMRRGTSILSACHASRLN